MSILNKKWIVAKKVKQDFFDKFPEYSAFVLQLLYNRGIKTQDQIDEFFNPDYSQDLFDPYLLKNMDRAVARLKLACEKQERVAIFGDYDADGVTSAVLLMELFRDVLKLKGQVYIPDRLSEGYGLNKKAIDWLNDKKIDLIVTCDCGVSNKDEIDYASSLGIDTIITDHHSLPHEFSDKYIVVNSKQKNDQYPFKELAGVGIVFKLAQAIIGKNKYFQDLKLKPGFEKRFLDLVSIGTVADCSPIISENRTLVKYGIEILKNTKRQGLNYLYDTAGVNRADINTYTIGFIIAPRINSAGRLDHANTAYKLLATKNYQEAVDLASEINKSNSKRQTITEQITQEAIEKIGDISDDKKILIAVGKNWPLGVVGIVAGKITERYNRPVLIAGKGEQETVGSARSIDTYNIIEAIAKNKEILLEYGGHKGAAGFTVKNGHAEEFFKNMEVLAKQKINNNDLVSKLSIDLQINIADVGWELVDDINSFEPYGIGNNPPLFLLRNMLVKNIKFLGKDKQHIKIEFMKKDSFIEGIGFGIASHLKDLQEGDIIDIVAEVGVNEWNGNKNIQLILRDVQINKKNVK